MSQTGLVGVEPLDVYLVNGRAQNKCILLTRKSLSKSFCCWRYKPLRSDFLEIELSVFENLMVAKGLTENDFSENL